MCDKNEGAYQGRGREDTCDHGLFRRTLRVKPSFLVELGRENDLQKSNAGAWRKLNELSEAKKLSIPICNPPRQLLTADTQGRLRPPGRNEAGSSTERGVMV